mmetsp:Transcript_24523/g.65465  ORF Transcript_24523/g.65465 Transcript_24523/m.65465 type:complete len:204 (-) Transcript_24523:82-693(-)
MGANGSSAINNPIVCCCCTTQHPNGFMMDPNNPLDTTQNTSGQSEAESHAVGKNYFRPQPSFATKEFLESNNLRHEPSSRPAIRAANAFNPATPAPNNDFPNWTAAELQTLCNTIDEVSSKRKVPSPVRFNVRMAQDFRRLKEEGRIEETKYGSAFWDRVAKALPYKVVPWEECLEAFMFARYSSPAGAGKLSSPRNVSSRRG